MKTKFFLSIASAAILFTSCSKSNSNNSSTPSSVDFQLRGINQSAAINQRTEGANVQWTSAIASPTLIKFEAKKDSSEVEFKSTNNQPINLLALNNSFGNITLPAGNYSEIEVKAQLNKNGSTPALELSGMFTNTATNTTLPITFTVDEFLEIKAEQSNVTVTNSTAFTSVTTLDLSKFTTGFTQSMVANAQLTNGILVISASSNSNLYNIILNNIRKTHHGELNHH